MVTTKSTKEQNAQSFHAEASDLYLLIDTSEELDISVGQLTASSFCAFCSYVHFVN